MDSEKTKNKKDKKKNKKTFTTIKRSGNHGR